MAVRASTSRVQAASSYRSHEDGRVSAATKKQAKSGWGYRPMYRFKAASSGLGRLR